MTRRRALLPTGLALVLAAVAAGCPPSSGRAGTSGDEGDPAVPADGDDEAGGTGAAVGDGDAEDGPPPEGGRAAGPPTERGSAAGPPMPPGAPDPADGQHQLGERPVRELRVGGARLRAHVVNTRSTRQLGLMHVRELPEDEGMLFVYPRPAPRSFWMGNTYIPLSLAYIADDAAIDQIVPHMKPLDEGPRYPSENPVRFVLEVNQGWFSRHGVEEGDPVEGLEGLVGYDGR